MDDREARERIARDVLAVGVRRGGALLVHSSLTSMGHVSGGAETVILGLLDALGPEGTLLMPALSYKTVGRANSVFDVLRTPSCVGAIAEYFRTRAGTMRSVHPTHSVCGVGAEVEAFLGDHHLDRTPVGPNSPLRRLRDRGGQILMLGCGLRPNTSMHGIEETVEPPYLFGAEMTCRIVSAGGSETEEVYRMHNFAGCRQRYGRVAQVLGAEGLREGKVLEARIHLLEARRLWERCAEALRANPFCFVDKREDQP